MDTTRIDLLGDIGLLISGLSIARAECQNEGTMMSLEDDEIILDMQNDISLLVPATVKDLVQLTRKWNIFNKRLEGEGFLPRGGFNVSLPFRAAWFSECQQRAKRAAITASALRSIDDTEARKPEGSRRNIANPLYAISQALYTMTYRAHLEKHT